MVYVVYKKLQWKNYGFHYKLCVIHKRFTFGDDMSHSFKEGEKYKFYYCKAGVYEFVMSYEVMSF